MTRKHFAAIAAILKAQRDSLDDELEAGRLDQVERVAKSLATYFESENPAFDRARFLDACGVVS